MVTEKEYLQALQIVKQYELAPENKDRILLSDFIEYVYNTEDIKGQTRLKNIFRSYKNEEYLKEYKYLDEFKKENFLQLRDAGMTSWLLFQRLQQKEIIINYRNNIKIAEQENVNMQLDSFPNAKELLRQFKDSIAETTNTIKELKQLEKKHKELIQAVKNKLKADNILREVIK